ncbi:hypothetical protein QBC38DRAFT_280471 [Podospora fimiseda]|uniref:Uncharacterized protein n=1 Tax=Podospora fimiseda TaxID=252190 RepID=A0AAN7BKE3_9PEZI|nr:hypothetical protein QBC38DRAFT_280471 [Podospora fimiseda]
MSPGSPYQTILRHQFPPSPGPSSTSSNSSRIVPEERPSIAHRLSRSLHVKPAPQEENNPFRDPVLIPDCSPATYVYPYSGSSINDKYHERFWEVVNIFKHNTFEDPKLRGNVRFIDYALRLCGPSPTDAHPSILVFCSDKEFKYLKRLLTSKELKFHFALRKTSRRLLWRKPGPLLLQDSHRPSFNLYFWRERVPRTLYWGQQTSVGIQVGPSITAPGFTLCGSTVRHGYGSGTNSFSTLGCVIQAGDEWYAVTSRHACYPELGDTGSDFMRSWMDYLPGIAITEATSKVPVEPGGKHLEDAPSQGEDEYCIDDIEYGSSTESDSDSGGETNCEVASHGKRKDDNPGYISQRQRLGSLTRGEEYICQFPTGIEQDRLGEFDLDWAIIELNDPKDWRPNAIPDPSCGDPRLQFLSTVADSLPSSPVSVLIITSESVPQEGLLQHGVTFLGCINGNRPAAVHTVILKKGQKLRKGDSGALVVNATSKVIYGLVVGANPLGEIYITPFHAILDQIRQRFPDVPVTIPEPVEMMKKLTSYLIQRVQKQGEDERFLKNATQKNYELEQEVAMLRKRVTAQQKLHEETERQAAFEKTRFQEENRTLQAKISVMRRTARARIDANQASVPPPASQLPAPPWKRPSTLASDEGVDDEKDADVDSWWSAPSVAGRSSADSGYDSLVGRHVNGKLGDKLGDILWEGDGT